MPANHSWTRLYSAAVPVILVGMLGVTNALRVESWPFSSYPMYSIPKRISDIDVSRFAFELDTGEVVFWEPDFPYTEKDLRQAVERSRGQPGFGATLETAARAVVADLYHDDSIEDPSRIRTVLLIRRTVRPEQDAGHFVVEDRTVASFPVETLR